MKFQFILTSILAALLVVAGAAHADDEADVRKSLGPDVQTCKIDGNWAMADVGDPQHGQPELFLLRRYKGQWQRVTTDGSTPSSTMLLALGMPDYTARSFGLGETTPEMAEALGKAMAKAGLHHRNYNIVTSDGPLFAYTTGNPHVDGYQIWTGNGMKWVKYFTVEPKLTQTQIDDLFRKHGISRFLQFRILNGHGTDM